MAVRLVCPSCAAVLSVKDEYAGRAVKCPKCGGRIPASQPADAPKPAPPPAPEKSPFDELDAPPRKPGRSKEAAGAKPRSRAEREDEDERPARAKRKRDADDEDDRPGKKRSNAPLILGVVAGVLLLGCGGLAGIGYLVTKQAEKELAKLDEDDERPRPAPVVRPTNDRVTAATFQKLKPLMTRAEVEAILGPGTPASNFDVSGAFDINAAPPGVLFEWEPKANAGRVLMWQSGPDHLFVAFHDKPDAGGKLQVKMFVPKSAGVARVGEPDDDKFVYENPQLATGGPPVEVSAVDLGRAAVADLAAARTKYADKRLTVTGTVAEVTEDQPDVQVGVILKGVPTKATVGPATTGVLCLIKIDAERKKSYALSRGQTVTVTGTATQIEPHFVTFANCSVTSTGPDPAPRLTPAALAAELKTDHAATETKYQGKEVTITGCVVVSTQGYVSLVVSAGGKETDSPQVRVAIARSERAGALKPGDPITVKGTFRGCTLSTVDIEQGWLVP